ncbi:MAG: dTMP kinase [Pseudomonadota bacterium]
MTGRFITVEGGEGAGKTSGMQALASILDQRGIPHLITREPGGTAIGERVRSILLDPKVSDLAVDAELLLVFAARAQHLATVIEPALADGTWVLCDRFTDASYAYQGGGRGMPFERIEVLEAWVQGERRPDLTLLLDLEPEQGLARALRDRPADRFERERTNFYRRVRRAYLERAKREPERIAVIDASRTRRAVLTEIRRTLTTFLEGIDD